ncbi:WhiB family transcriptional regulator, redox-sensing transcriptional regulator [Amycolatopsis marina]|uniref:Transcriptional regulator WhiB n=1 Tax=Amycolatopsis marina TaxID=490629 RepID=A0A1I0WT13_9PSEU|nr:WhiB family transcriptional regulator [Amycolatopsis marina]SFA91136.1 WhiB family transcriptional regulator, redox-sensing transcriptional regulator [Amycolatopsis marina]
MTETSRLPVPVAETWEWQRLGNCRNLDSSVFFHPDGERGFARSDRVARAKQVCRSCRVIVECRHHALTAQEPFGVWGGLDEQERRDAIRRRRQLPAA